MMNNQTIGRHVKGILKEIGKKSMEDRANLRQQVIEMIVNYIYKDRKRLTK